MTGRVIQLLVTVSVRPGTPAVPVSVNAGDTVGHLLDRIQLSPLSLSPAPGGWELVFDGRVLTRDRTFGEFFPPSPTAYAVLLRPVATGRCDTPPGAPHHPATEAPPALALDEDDFDEDFEGSEFEEAPARTPPDTRSWRKAKAETEQRRATVRYYSRMNPDRVFPLLVMLTREEVELVVKRHVEQAATGPLKLDADTPLEIEPVLPGCAVYPPKVVARLGSADQSFTFHVVPHVLGDVTGARVFVRQDLAVLAEVELDVRVVQRTLVVVSGVSTVVMPVASAAMRHFGLDFAPKDGGNPYLALLDLLFGKVPPVLLMAALAVVTGAAWWLTRPKGRDVFWDVSTKPASPPGQNAGGNR